MNRRVKKSLGKMMDVCLEQEVALDNELGILKIIDMFLHFALSDANVIGPLNITITAEEIF